MSPKQAEHTAVFLGRKNVHLYYCYYYYYLLVIDSGVDGRIILRWTFRKWDGDMDWIDLARDRDR
jgi:hypothetical protein